MAQSALVAEVMTMATPGYRALSGLILATMFAVVTACGGSPAASPTSPLSPLANTHWTLTATQAFSVPSGVALNLDFDALTASGFAGCNTFTAGYKTLDTGIKFGGVATTQKACDPTTMTLEQAYLTSFPLVDHYALAGNTLTLTSAGGGADLTYTARSQ